MRDMVRVLREQSEWTPLPPTGHAFPHTVLTSFERDGGSVDSWALARLVVPRLAELVHADRVFAGYWAHWRQGLLGCARQVCDRRCDWADLMRRSDVDLDGSGELPHRTAFERDGTLVLPARTEFRSRVGRTRLLSGHARTAPLRLIGRPPAIGSNEGAHVGDP